MIVYDMGTLVITGLLLVETTGHPCICFNPISSQKAAMRNYSRFFIHGWTSCRTNSRILVIRDASHNTRKQWIIDYLLFEIDQISCLLSTGYDINFLQDNAYSKLLT